MRGRSMRIAILHNRDFDALANDPAREARADVLSVAGALRDALAARHEVALMGLGREPLADLQAVLRHPPDVAFNLCESVLGDARGEALVPLTLELAGIPFTGSGHLALALSLHKPRAKELLRARGVPTPDWAEVRDAGQASQVALPFPLIVKPSREDASAGIHARSVVRGPAELARAVREVVLRFGQSALVERFVEGRELCVALLGQPLRALPVSEIDFSALPAHLPPIVTYAGKWDPESVECVATPPVDAVLPPRLASRVVEVAMAAFEALGARDYGRVDLRLGRDGVPQVIDVNPNCDLAPGAGFARAAARAGLDPGALAEELVQLAWRRHGAATAPTPRPAAARAVALADSAVHARRGRLRPRAG